MSNSQNTQINYKSRAYFFFTVFLLYAGFEFVSFALYELGDCYGTMDTSFSYCKPGFEFVMDMSIIAGLAMIFAPLALIVLFIGLYNLFKHYKTKGNH